VPGIAASIVTNWGIKPPLSRCYQRPQCHYSGILHSQSPVGWSFPFGLLGPWAKYDKWADAPEAPIAHADWRTIMANPEFLRDLGSVLRQGDSTIFAVLTDEDAAVRVLRG
jgi:hypothetical protein